MPSRLCRVICHNGLEKAPEHPMAAVKNLGHAFKCDPASLCGAWGSLSKSKESKSLRLF